MILTPFSLRQQFSCLKNILPQIFAWLLLPHHSETSLNITKRSLFWPPWCSLSIASISFQIIQLSKWNLSLSKIFYFFTCWFSVSLSSRMQKRSVFFNTLFPGLRTNQGAYCMHQAPNTYLLKGEEKSPISFTLIFLDDFSTNSLSSNLYFPPQNGECLHLLPSLWSTLLCSSALWKLTPINASPRALLMASQNLK